jgi:hypothetical protein
MFMFSEYIKYFYLNFQIFSELLLHAHIFNNISHVIRTVSLKRIPKCRKSNKQERIKAGNNHKQRVRLRSDEELTSSDSPEGTSVTTI